MSHIMDTYARLGIDIVSGKGCYVTDAQGRQYTDFCSGIAVNTLGHCHPVMVETLKSQADTLWHVSNIFTSQKAEDLAQKLCESSFAEKVFFCNSGAEAVEGVIKTVRKYAHEKGHYNRNRIITFNGAFHGRTLATISATHRYTDGFAPVLGGFDLADMNDIESVKRAIGDNTIGILIEPIQGEGGVIPATAEFLQQLRTLCDEHDLVLAFDEVQSGMARTGTMWAYQSCNVKPDIMAIAKGLGGGFPIGAVLSTKRVCVGMCAGTHGSTFGGNPLAVSVADSVLETIRKENILDNVKAVESMIKQHLDGLCDTMYIRGKGLLLGMVFDETIDTQKIHQALLDNGIITIKAGQNVIRLLPPLNITLSETEQALEQIKKSILSQV